MFFSLYTFAYYICYSCCNSILRFCFAINIFIEIFLYIYWHFIHPQSLSYWYIFACNMWIDLLNICTWNNIFYINNILPLLLCYQIFHWLAFCWILIVNEKFHFDVTLVEQSELGQYSCHIKKDGHDLSRVQIHDLLTSTTWSLLFSSWLNDFF
jgi:hypothetical protein